MDGHGCIAEHCLRACGSHDHSRPAVCCRIADVPQVPLSLFMLDLEVGETCRATRAPVGDTGAAIDQPLLVEQHKGLSHRARIAIIQREALAAPVHGGPETLELLADVVVVGLLDLPHALDEGLAADIMARQAFLRQALLERSGAIRRVYAGSHRLLASMACPARSGLVSSINRMSHVEDAVTSRPDDNAKAFPTILHCRREHAFVQPLLVMSRSTAMV